MTKTVLAAAAMATLAAPAAATPTPVAAKPATPTSFKRANEAYPPEMRTQLWPLCCGVSILSGFKNVGNLGPDELVKQISDTLKATPDLQVYGHETIKPNLTFLTLNGVQMGSKSIRQAVERVGFVQIGQGSSHNPGQGFFVYDPGNKFKLTAPNGTVIDAKAACGC